MWLEIIRELYIASTSLGVELSKSDSESGSEIESSCSTIIVNRINTKMSVVIN